MAQALERVKRELGPDAVILSARSLDGAGPGRVAGFNRVEIRAAAPRAPGKPSGPRRAAVATQGRSACGLSGGPAEDGRGGSGDTGRVRTLRARGTRKDVVRGRGSGRGSCTEEQQRSGQSAGLLVRPGGAAQNDQGDPAMGGAAAFGPNRSGREDGFERDPLPDERTLYQRLVESEVADDLARRIAHRAAELASADPVGGRTALKSALSRIVAELMPGTVGIDLSKRGQRRVALVGPPGSGKTTTIAKLAAHLKLRLARRVAILSMDMNRLAAHEQIRRYGEIIGVPVFEAQTIGTARGILASFEGFDVVLIDTPGLGPRDTARLPRLSALLGVVRPHEVHLTMPASLTPAVQAGHAALFGPLGVSHLVLTRMDEAVGIGVILNAVERLGWAVSYVTDGQVVPNDIREACSRSIVELILEKVT